MCEHNCSLDGSYVCTRCFGGVYRCRSVWFETCMLLKCEDFQLKCLTDFAYDKGHSIERKGGGGEGRWRYRDEQMQLQKQPAIGH